MKTAAVPLSFARMLGKHCNFEVMACCVAARQVSQNHREIWLPGLKYCAMLMDLHDSIIIVGMYRRKIGWVLPPNSNGSILSTLC